MATLENLPGTLDLKFVPGDEIRVDCDFDVNITGYTITNSVYVASNYASVGGGGGYITAIGATVTTFDQTVVDAAAGQIRLTLPEVKSALLTPTTAYRWYLRWVDTGSVTRTVMSGAVTVVNP
jgi:hypothetical protein